MEHASSYDLLKDLPAPATFLDPKGEKASVFASLRAWVKKLSPTGELQQAGRILGDKYRCAVLCFVTRESSSGVRRSQAQELLKILAEVPEWAAEAAMSLEELEAAAAEVASLPAPALAGAARSGMMKELLEGLPTRNTLEDPNSSSQEVFSQLHRWIKARLKEQPSRLAEAGQLLDVEHRRSVFDFLCAFTSRKTVMRSRSREALWHLAGLDLTSVVCQATSCSTVRVMARVGAPGAYLWLFGLPRAEEPGAKDKATKGAGTAAMFLALLSLHA